MRNDLTLQVPWYSGLRFLNLVLPQCIYVMANMIAGITVNYVYCSLQVMAVFCMQGSSAPVNSFTMWKHKSSQSHTKATRLKIYFQLLFMSKLCFEKKYLRNVIGCKIPLGIISLFFWITATHWLVRSATVINIVASLLVKCFINLLVFFSTVLRKKYIYQSIIVR